MRLHIAVAVLGGIALSTAAQAQTESESGRSNSFYGEARGGFVVPLDSDVDNSNDDLSYDIGYVVAGALGFKFASGLRLEAEGSYREYDADEFDGRSASGEAEIGTILGNVFYDFQLGPFTPYIGGGLGVSFIDLDDVQSGGINFDVDDGTQFAFAAHAGLAFAVTERLDVTFNYTFLGHEVDLYSNNFTGGLRVEF